MNLLLSKVSQNENSALSNREMMHISNLLTRTLQVVMSSRVMSSCTVGKQETLCKASLAARASKVALCQLPDLGERWRLSEIE